MEEARVPQPQHQRGHRLANFVVQFTSDSFAFLFLRVYQPRGELFELNPRRRNFFETLRGIAL